MRVLVDMDEVLVDLLGYICDVYNSETGNNLSKENFHCWNLNGCLPLWSKERLDRFFKEDNVFHKLKPINKAVVGFKHLIENFDTYIVSSAYPETAHGKSLWLSKYFPEFDQRRVFYCNKKYMVDGDVLIDDGPHNIEDFRKKGKVIIFDMPYNRDIKEDNNCVRVYDWGDALAQLYMWKLDMHFKG